jgi:hypothetical protein
LSNASVEVEDMKTKDDLLQKELNKKDEMVKMLQVQLRLNEEMHHNTQSSDSEVNSQEPNIDRIERENLLQKQTETEERLKALEETLVRLN